MTTHAETVRGIIENVYALTPEERVALTALEQENARLLKRVRVLEAKRGFPTPPDQETP